MEWHSNQANESKGCVEETIASLELRDIQKSEGFSDNKILAMLESFQHSTLEMFEDIKQEIDVMQQSANSVRKSKN